MTPLSPDPTAHEEAIAESIRYLLVAWPERKFPPATVEAYVQDLSDLPVWAIRDAAAKLRKTARWFPSIAEWREAAEKLLADVAVSSIPTSKPWADPGYVPPSPEGWARIKARLALMFPRLGLGMPPAEPPKEG